MRERVEKYSHSLVGHDPVGPARLEVALNLALSVDLHTPKYVFWPIKRNFSNFDLDSSN